MKAAAAAVPEKNGFRGYYYTADAPARRTMIVVLGDEGNDFMSLACARWLIRTQNCNALCIALRQTPADDTGLHSWPLERIQAGIRWLQKQGMEQIGILGMSMQASLALTAASLLPELSMVIALAPGDFVPWGFYQGKIGKDAHGEWPSGTSAFSWQGQDLPWQPAFLEKEAYWQMYCDAKRQYGELHSIAVFEHSEQQRPIPEECMIRVENIRGKVVLVGSEDDSMWNTSRYIRRMQTRLAEKGRPAPEVLLYPRGTHLLVPQRMLTMALPVIGGSISLMFASGRSHLKECKQARLDLDSRLTAILRQW